MKIILLIASLVLTLVLLLQILSLKITKLSEYGQGYLVGKIILFFIAAAFSFWLYRKIRTKKILKS